MSDTNHSLLDELKDIHYPEMVSWWPPAIGWWLIALLLAITSVVSIFIIKRAWKKMKQKRILLNELNLLRQQYQQQQCNITEPLSILIKRAAMIRYPRQQVAALQGQAWLDFLNQTTNTAYFSQELITAPYQAMAPERTMTLLTSTESWLKKII